MFVVGKLSLIWLSNNEKSSFGWECRWIEFKKWDVYG